MNWLLITNIKFTQPPLFCTLFHDPFPLGCVRTFEKLPHRNASTILCTTVYGHAEEVKVEPKPLLTACKIGHVVKHDSPFRLLTLCRVTEHLVDYPLLTHL